MLGFSAWAVDAVFRQISVLLGYRTQLCAGWLSHFAQVGLSHSGSFVQVCALGKGPPGAGTAP